MCNAPCKRYLSARLAILLAGLVQCWVVDQLAQVFSLAVDWILVAKRRILRYMDSVLVVPLLEPSLLQPWVQLDLVSCRYHAGLFDEPLHLGLREVAHANGLSLALLHYLRFEISDQLCNGNA